MPAPDRVEILRRLIAFDTTSSNSNLPLLDYVCELLDRPGVRFARLPNAEGDKANLLVELGPEGRDGLLLSGHTDVVPALEPGWKSDPFRLTTEGDRWVARGSADMKGFLALAVDLVRGLDPARLRRPLALLFTYDEELGTLGAQRFVSDWQNRRALPKLAVIGEPTSLAVVRLHKGHLKLRLTLHGRAAHSSLPHLGKNAIEAAGRAITALSALRRRLESERPAHSEHFPGAPFATLNQAIVHGGVAVNVVPERCTLELGLRPLPGMASADLRERVRDALTATLAADEFLLEELGDSPALLCPAEAPHARFLCAEVGQLDTRGASFASDAGPLQWLGIESVLFGPGSIEVAHKPNEFLPRTEFERAAVVFERLVDRFCGETAA